MVQLTFRPVATTFCQRVLADVQVRAPGAVPAATFGVVKLARLSHRRL